MSEAEKAIGRTLAEAVNRIPTAAGQKYFWDLQKERQRWQRSWGRGTYIQPSCIRFYHAPHICTILN